jgi:uncharacterized repeat protein (TIGR03803 family)
MRSKKLSVGLAATLSILCATLFVTITPATGQTERVLHTFANTSGGQAPNANLIFDSSGNLYGVTEFGGNASCHFQGGPATTCGTVFELSPTSGGGWKETVLHDFGHDNDGGEPRGGLIADAAGNLYGTAFYGGTGYCEDGFGTLVGCGVIFKLTPAADGAWTETILHDFLDNGTDGSHPQSNLTFDSSGNLYGMTYIGGAYDLGTVFELTPKPAGIWTERVLHSFNLNGTDGFFPEGGLVFDASGNLYGTTPTGGAYNQGTVFELKSIAGGGWSEEVLHSFQVNGADGFFPDAGLAIDAAGNLYGTTFYGGVYGEPACGGCGGTSFAMIPTQGGGWTETILYSFGNGNDAAIPAASLTIDADGNLYGTTVAGGAYDYSGAAFELSPTQGGGWTERVLHSFGATYDGAFPSSGLTLDATGNLYGATESGCVNSLCGYGTVFKITP